MRRGRAVRRLRLLSLLSLLPVSVMAAVTPGTSWAQTSTCTPSSGYLLCLNVARGVLAGDQPVFVTATPQSPAGKIARIEFTWNGQYLIYKYQSPYQFAWPTAKFIDGPGTLAARVVTIGSAGGSWGTATVTLANGNISSVPKNPANWATAFSPEPYTGEPLIAAVGSGASGKPRETAVIGSIKAHHPTAFLYLGDVDEFGDWTTYYNNYGLSALDDPTGQGTLWGSMARYTASTPGNHESGPVYEPTWQDYWHQRPLWSTFTIGDIRFFDLSSNCGPASSCTDSGQTTWLAQQLATNTSRCIVSFWHIPIVSEDYARNLPKMDAAWALLAQHGGDLVINAHTHDMEQTAPLNALGLAGQPDSHMVELISGAAAGRWELQFAADSRVVWERYMTPGAVYVGSVHNPNGSEQLNWWFEDTLGTVLRTGSIMC
jgi:Calcineurin-like phosphoesterase